MVKCYSRSHEREAGEMAVKLVIRSGYAADGMLAMLQAIHKPGGATSGWYATHPSPEKRISNIESSISISAAVGRKNP